MSNVLLPQEPGHYIWHISDLSYMEIGLVHITIDPEKHRDRLREQGLLRSKENPLQFFMYKNDDGVELTMYHEAYPHHMPPCNANGEPFVEGYRKIDLKDII